MKCGCLENTYSLFSLNKNLLGRKQGTWKQDPYLSGSYQKREREIVEIKTQGCHYSLCLGVL